MDKYKKGQKIVSSGEIVSFVGKVIAGRVRIEKTVQGRQVVLPGLNLFEDWSVMMVLSGEKSEMEVVAATNVEIEKISAEVFKKQLEADAKTRDLVLKKVTKTWTTQMEMLTCIIGASAPGKVAKIILSLVDEGYPLTHKLISEMTGLTRETVTLQMLKLEKMKLIDNSDRKVVVLDKTGLKKLM